MSICERCFTDTSVGEHGQYKCPYEARKATQVIGDDIPGGVVIYNGACWPDGSPRRHYSKSSIAKAAKANGWEPGVRHMPQPKSGSDKSKHTTRWI